jgi:hypothetical protein
MSTTRHTTNSEGVLARFRDPCTGSREATGDDRRFSDANDMRRTFGFPPFDPDAFTWGLIPDVLIHAWEPGEGRTAGGTDLLAVGKPGSGKSTLGCFLAERLEELNSEKSVWRGSPSRSEWLPLAPWTTLWLPRGDIEIQLEPKDKTRGTVRIDVDELDAIVRDVQRYTTTRELLEALDPGFNVVYPDPELRGCQAILDRSARQVESPAEREALFAPEDPDNHWWFAWFLDRVDQGPHDFTTWFCDEIGDLAPQNARKDDYGTYQKVELLTDSWVDARKHGLSIFGFGHSEADVHAMIRRKMRWRVSMPTSANPTSASGLSGFESVPMRSDMTSKWSPGKALCYTESTFQKFKWADMPVGHNWSVKIRPHGGT